MCLCAIGEMPVRLSRAGLRQGSRLGELEASGCAVARAGCDPGGAMRSITRHIPRASLAIFRRSGIKYQARIIAIARINRDPREGRGEAGASAAGWSARCRSVIKITNVGKKYGEVHRGNGVGGRLKSGIKRDKSGTDEGATTYLHYLLGRCSSKSLESFSNNAN